MCCEVTWATWPLARPVCYALACVCGASLRCAQSSIRTAAICSQQGAGYPSRAHSSVRTAAVRRRQEMGPVRAHTRPSGRRLFCSRQGLGSLPGAHTSIWTAAPVAWHLSSCRGSLRVVRALWVCSTRRASLLGTCPCAYVVAGSVPLRRASWPRVLRRTLSGQVALRAPVGFSDAVVPFPTPGACAPGFTWWLHGARGGRPRTGLILPAAGPRRGRGAGLAPPRTRSGPRDGVVPGGSLRCRSWAACAAVVGWVDPVTDASGSPYPPWFDEGLAGAPGLFNVDADTSPCGSEDTMPGSRACVPVLVRPCRVGLAGLPGAFGAPHLFLWPTCRSALLSPLRAGVAPSWSFVCPPTPPFASFFFDVVLRGPFVSCFLWLPALGALGLSAVCCLFCWPPASRLSVRSPLFCVARLAVGCSLVVAPPPPWCLVVFVAAARCRAFVFVFFLFSAPPLSLAFSGFRPWVP